MGQLVVIAPDLLSMAVCLFLGLLLRENIVVSRFKTAAFLGVVRFVAIVLAAEIATVYVDASGIQALDVLDEVLYCTVYAAAPITFLLLALLFDDGMRRHRALVAVAAGLSALFVFSNFIHHGLFSVTGATVYERGPLYPVYLVLAVAAGVVFLFANARATRDRGGYRQWILYGVFFLVIGTTAIEVVDSRVLVIWPGIVVGMVLYYVYLRELQFSFDPLTNVLNRRAFSEEMGNIANGAPVTLAMLDLNGLKPVNDLVGHETGDEYLTAVAGIAEAAFGGVGRCFRIGGDEFCVISHDVDSAVFDRAVAAFREAVAMHNREVDYEFSVAIGIASRVSDSENPFDVLARADAGMYRDKSSGRRYFREAMTWGEAMPTEVRSPTD